MPVSRTSSLDVGGPRVANPRRSRVGSSRHAECRIKFDKGDHEAFYPKEGNKVTGERWGTFVRGFKDPSRQRMATQDFQDVCRLGARHQQRRKTEISTTGSGWVAI
jgi:hypothetical protein